MQFLDKYAAQLDLTGRILLGGLFVMSGLRKIGNYAGTQGYMGKAGVPDELLPLVILTEVGCGLMIITGFKARIGAFLLAGYCLLTVYFFHNFMDDPSQMSAAMKNIALAGAFLILVRAGAGSLSMDAKKAAG